MERVRNIIDGWGVGVKRVALTVCLLFSFHN